MEDNTTGLIAGGIGGLLYLAMIVAAIAGFWKMFEKAGKPGWAAIIPIYNLIVLFEIIGKPLWHIILLFIPIANIYVVITMAVSTCKSYGRTGIGSYLLAIFLAPFYYMYLGFSSNVRYVGPSEGPQAVVTSSSL